MIGPAIWSNLHFLYRYVPGDGFGDLDPSMGRHVATENFRANSLTTITGFQTCRAPSRAGDLPGFPRSWTKPATCSCSWHSSCAKPQSHFKAVSAPLASSWHGLSRCRGGLLWSAFWLTAVHRCSAPGLLNSIFYAALAAPQRAWLRNIHGDDYHLLGYCEYPQAQHGILYAAVCLGLEGIPDELPRAAAVDGAGVWAPAKSTSAAEGDIARPICCDRSPDLVRFPPLGTCSD